MVRGEERMAENPLYSGIVGISLSGTMGDTKGADCMVRSLLAHNHQHYRESEPDGLTMDLTMGFVAVCSSRPSCQFVKLRVPYLEYSAQCTHHAV